MGEIHGQSAPEAGHANRPNSDSSSKTTKERRVSEPRALAEREVEKLIEATSSHRDATMILLAFRHGLRAAELVDLRWDQVDFEKGVLRIRRAKAGMPASGPESHAQIRFGVLPPGLRRGLSGTRHCMVTFW